MTLLGWLRLLEGILFSWVIRLSTATLHVLLVTGRIGASLVTTDVGLAVLVDRWWCGWFDDLDLSLTLGSPPRPSATR